MPKEIYPLDKILTGSDIGNLSAKKAKCVNGFKNLTFYENWLQQERQETNKK